MTSKTGLFCISILIAAAIFLSSSSFAQRVGNGGGAWICQKEGVSSDYRVRWIKFLDLYEAREEFRLRIPRYSREDRFKILKRMQHRIKMVDRELAKELDPYFSSLNDNMKFVNQELRVIQDALYRIMPDEQDCRRGTLSYVQLANHTGYGTILVNRRLWEHPRFSELDKAALMLHEVIYAYLRDKVEVQNSVSTRMAVGFIFSNIPVSRLGSKLELVPGLLSER